MAGIASCFYLVLASLIGILGRMKMLGILTPSSGVACLAKLFIVAALTRLVALRLIAAAASRFIGGEIGIAAWDSVSLP